MDQTYIPTIGSTGAFLLAIPFTTPEGERYTCMAIRKLGDYLAQNETPYELIYEPKGLTVSDYEADMAVNMEIISLQSEKGFWIHVPAKYITSYPITNGIPYRKVGFMVGLPPVPTDKDLTFLETQIANLVKDTLGVVPKIQLVEQSKVVLIPSVNADATETARQLLASGRNTDYSRVRVLEQQLQDAFQKIQALEAWILDHL